MAPTTIDCASSEKNRFTSLSTSCWSKRWEKASLKKISETSYSARESHPIYSYSLIDVVNTLPPPRHPSGIDTFFFEQGSNVPDPRELDSSRKNLMVFDDLMLSKQNTCEDYYVRSRH
ncbi:Hypothetical predicted protein [Mytilus galloprovincialis]|uniref:Uncharacterized protein n=1 Tax=Mytilus galloprovincialis TaxID=29158 RepID=A0A8B6CNB0_MYTGA|nr:Hypothetical predicted protein [Mytilus galloprovincialis]